MKILYVTDLHGDILRYNKTLQVALREKVSIVINGGYMFSNRDQETFLDRLPLHFEEFQDAKIYYLCMLGNDDLQIFDKEFDGLCNSYSYVKNIAQHKVKILGYEFIGMNWVHDYPFRLKDRCRLDNSNDHCDVVQFGAPLFSVFKDEVAIEEQHLLNPLKKESYESYLHSIPTLEDELKALPIPQNKEKCFYVIHMPPADLDLDQCLRGPKVGSPAILQFLKEMQPAFSLHGHIHESPTVSGKWLAELGKTICIQPGQKPFLQDFMTDTIANQFLTYVLIDLDEGFVERVDEPLCQAKAQIFKINNTVTEG